jgi:hypothetical protein
MSVAGQNTRLTLLKQHLAAIAVVFDLVNPVIPLRGLIDERCELRLDEAEWANDARHAPNLKPLL